MDTETVLDELEQNTAAFITTMCYREMDEMETDVLNHDGHVIVANKNKHVGSHGIWRALHEAVTGSNTEILLVSPNPAGTRGSLLLIEDELDRAPFSNDVWGLQRSTRTTIEFENGSRIKSHHAGGEDGADRIRGYKPDLLVVDNWTEGGYEITDGVRTEVLLPMLATDDTDLWINDVKIRDDPLTNAALSDGAYVKRM